MSLWEVELLNKHAVVSVQQMGSLFLTDFTNPAARKVQLEDFLDITTGSLLSRELKAINKPSSEITLANFAGNPTKVPIPVDVPNLHAASMNIAKLCSC
ncbi:hypothetical protein, conserved [Eimeria tenella]|uniref:Uncharacterized protein n=1 Tax=Eimeria tenella TaxID=5802 RepID=U6KU06_EIMTE|nr:hypothetical protein, conserved [Eimeria tenella]CDJ38965.1 hypothetical protein, conserved [Eimeria tenella]|eukprot:XP_013229720.1 hypothetical protein, conserved [Eimeria tenella]